MTTTAREARKNFLSIGSMPSLLLLLLLHAFPDEKLTILRYVWNVNGFHWLTDWTEKKRYSQPNILIWSDRSSSKRQHISASSEKELIIISTFRCDIFLLPGRRNYSHQQNVTSLTICTSVFGGWYFKKEAPSLLYNAISPLFVV